VRLDTKKILTALLLAVTLGSAGLSFRLNTKLREAREKTLEALTLENALLSQKDDEIKKLRDRMLQLGKDHNRLVRDLAKQHEDEHLYLEARHDRGKAELVHRYGKELQLCYERRDYWWERAVSWRRYSSNTLIYFLGDRRGPGVLQACRQQLAAEVKQ